MKPDGSIHPTLNKNKVITVLESLSTVAPGADSAQELNLDAHHCLIVDGMAVVQELMAVKSFKNCDDLGNAYVKLINAKASKYYVTRVIFDNYSKAQPLQEATRQRRRGSKVPAAGF